MPRAGRLFQHEASQEAARKRAAATTAPCGHTLEGFKLAWDVGEQTPERSGKVQCMACGDLLTESEYLALRDGRRS